MADAGFSGGVGIGGVGEPSAFVDEAFETAGPVGAEFFDVVATHLVDDEHDHEFGALRGGGFAGGLGLLRLWCWRLSGAGQCAERYQSGERESEKRGAGMAESNKMGGIEDASERRWRWNHLGLVTMRRV